MNLFLASGELGKHDSGIATLTAVFSLLKLPAAPVIGIPTSIALSIPLEYLGREYLIVGIERVVEVGTSGSPMSQMIKLSITSRNTLPNPDANQKALSL